MKKNHILIVALMVMFISSCSKDDKEHLAPHDGNKIMSQMHVMMSKMMALQMTKDPEVDFLRMMVMHHQGAINMANIDLSEGQNDSLKIIAQKIITEQQAEIIKFNPLCILTNVDFDIINIPIKDKLVDILDYSYCCYL